MPRARLPLLLLLLPLAAGCLDEAPPSAPVDDVVVPPAAVAQEVPVSFDGAFGFEGCIASACIFLQNANAYTHEMGGASLSALNLTASWDALEPGAELKMRLECRVGAGRACPGARVLAEGQGPPPLTVSAAGLSTPPGARIDVFVEAVRTLPPTFVNDQYHVQGAFTVLKDPAAQDLDDEEA